MQEQYKIAGFDFSTTKETFTGWKWIDGKNIYTKVIKTHVNSKNDSNNPSMTEVSIKHNILNIDNGLYAIGIFSKDDTPGFNYLLPYIPTLKGLTSMSHFSRDDVAIRIWNDSWDRDCYIICFYTKTTN